MTAQRALGRQFTRQALRDDMHLAQVPQGRREESATKGYKTERKSFYGHHNTATMGEAETRLTTTSADQEHAARRANDAEEARVLVPMTHTEHEDTTRELKEAGW